MNALIIFIKNPSLGSVKTRLAKTVGDLKALDIYKSLLDFTRITTSLFKANRYLFYSDKVSEDMWKAELFQKKEQEGSNLGERMFNAFETVLKSNDKAVLIGSDCAQLNTMVLSEAFKALHDHDIVIGPSLDGGYYLLGMKSSHPELFSGIVWSTDQVFPRTLDKINSLGLSYHELPTLSDIDHEEDWENFGWELD